MVQRDGTRAQATSEGAPGPRKAEPQWTTTATAGFLPLFGEDVGTTVERVVSLALPLRAEACLVDLVGGLSGDDGALREVAARAVDGVAADALAQLGSRLERADPLGSARTAERAWPLLLAPLGGAATAESAFAERARALGFGSLIAAPIRARGRLLGVVTLLSARDAPRFDRDDVSFAEALAEHAAIALHEARRRDELLRAIRTRDELLATLAVELRDPLATLAATLHRLLRRGAAEARERVGVRRATLRIERLLDDVMALVRLRTGHLALRLVDRAPSALLRDAMADVESLLGDRPLRVEALGAQDADGGEPRLRCDAERTRHALGNLLGNAARWAPPGGRVAVQVRTELREVVFRVCDDGPAIDAPELAATHARPLASALASRAGVSLAIARELVAAQGGRLWADPAGGGSALCVALPRD